MRSSLRLLAGAIISCGLLGLGTIPLVHGADGDSGGSPPGRTTATSPASPSGDAAGTDGALVGRARTGAGAPLALPPSPAATPGIDSDAATAARRSSPALDAPAAAGDGSPNMAHVANLDYQRRYDQAGPVGTDLELATVSGRDYAFAGTYRNGLQVIDVTDPARPQVVAVYDCAVAQGDVQVFSQGGRTLATYTADDIETETRPESGCYRELGVDPAQPYGTFIVDVTDPRAPRGVGFVPIPAGSHNQTVHPGGRYLYNSNADLTAPGVIEVIDIADPTRPRQVATLSLGPGLSSHDVTFNADGTRAYSAALTHSLVIDTSDPARPRVVGSIVDPSINIHHQADPVTVDDPLLGRRTFLVVTDELAGAAGNGVCPGGGLHVYDITGDRERLPVKVGFFAIPDTRPANDSLRCTAHVLRMYPEHKLLTIAWYSAGVRVIDISGLAGVSAGLPVDAGMREIGYYAFPDSDTWSAKTNRIAPDGSFFLFANDIARGFDVYRFRGPEGAGEAGLVGGGRWLSPEQVLAEARSRVALPVSATNALYCLIR
jgi:hypothetical protein